MLVNNLGVTCWHDEECLRRGRQTSSGACGEGGVVGEGGIGLCLFAVPLGGDSRWRALITTELRGGGGLGGGRLAKHDIGAVLQWSAAAGGDLLTLVTRGGDRGAVSFCCRTGGGLCKDRGGGTHFLTWGALAAGEDVLLF